MEYPSYAKNGTVYNSYTDEPAKVISITEAAQILGVTPRTMQKYIKKYQKIRLLSSRNKHTSLTEPRILDYELEHFKRTVLEIKYPRRSWAKTTALMKDLRLVNGKTLLKRLEDLENKEWSDIQMRVNEFGKTHVEAYRRGIRDAIRELRSEDHTEAWDYIPHIGHLVWVGGCTGVIHDVTENDVVVKGTYRFSVNVCDNWSFTYSRKDIESRTIKPWAIRRNKETGKVEMVIWNYEDINYMDCK